MPFHLTSESWQRLSGKSDKKCGTFMEKKARNCYLLTTKSLLQLRDMMKRTIDSWLRLFDEEWRKFLPTFHISLTLDDNGMQLYPNSDDLLVQVSYVIEETANTFQSVR